MKMPHWPVPLGFRDIKLGLSRVYDLLERLGNPHLMLPPAIHVAGTNGKGSTLAFLRAVFERAGYSCHVYTSPHLVSFNERIVLAGGEITDDYVHDIMEECRLAAGDDLPITFFEGTTVGAFLAFSRSKADVLLLETGLGGRLDATNVIAQPAATVITPISYDHQEYLGDTIQKIAYEKAGIMKQGTPCAVGRQTPEALKTLLGIAGEKGAFPLIYGQDFEVVNKEGAYGYVSKSRSFTFPQLSLTGEHQYDNAALAVATLDALKGFEFSESAIVAGLQSAVWPGRLHHLKTGALVEAMPPGWELWLDGGHNPDAAIALAKQAGQWKRQGRKIIGVVSMLRDKDAAGFLNTVTRAFDALYFPTPPDKTFHDPLELLQIARDCAFSEAYRIEGLPDVIKARGDEPVTLLACGSLYYIGSLLEQNAQRG